MEMVFEHHRWEAAYVKANDKHIDLKVLKQLADPQTRVRLYIAILTEQIEIPPCYMELQEKDTPGEYRTVYVAEPEWRVILSIINSCLFELFGDMVHPQCRSYLSGESCGKTVTEVSDVMVKLSKNIKYKKFARKYDFKSYFDCVALQAILDVFDELERRLGFEPNTEPLINMLRKFYKSNLVFDLEGNLIETYMALHQGIAVASFLADVILYELDDFMTKKYKYYWRYSDDVICFSENVDEITEDINRIIHKYGVRLNDKKTQDLYTDSYYKFLGFDLCGDSIMLSSRRVKKFTKEIVARTIAKPWITPNQARESIKRYMYGDGDSYSWATSCFSALRNCDEDILVLDKFVMDALRLVEIRYNYNQERRRKGLKPREMKWGFKEIGGIGIVNNSSTNRLVRGTGTKVGTGLDRTQKEIDNYLTIGCLLKNYKTDKNAYQACVRSM